VAYASGQGVRVDFVEAFRWYDRAAGKGHPQAAKTLESLIAEMTPEQLAEARKPGDSQ
jgi:TPR repeat protein